MSERAFCQESYRDVKRAAQTLDANNKATDWREMRLFALTGSSVYDLNRVNDTILSFTTWIFTFKTVLAVIQR